MKIKNCFILIFLVFGLFSNSGQVHAQDGIFSQYYAAPLYLNPALVNLDQNIDVGVNYRSQLLNNQYAYNSSQFSLTYPIVTQDARDPTLLNHKGAGGLSAFTESVGENGFYNTAGVMLTAGYNLHLNKESTMRLAMGVQGGYVQQSVNPEQYKWASQYVNLQGFDLTLPEGQTVDQPTQGYPVVNAGITFLRAIPKDEADSTSRAKFFYAGISASYLNQPSLDFEVLEKSPRSMLLKGQVGMDLNIGQKMKLSPNFIFQNANGLSQFFGGLYIYYTLKEGEQTEEKKSKSIDLVGGLWYRQSGEAVGMLGARFSKFTLGVSYDYRLSALGQGVINTDVFEISLRVRLKGKVREEKLKIYKPMLII